MTAPAAVLVVEDDDDIRECLMDYLEDKGFRPVGAANGREALAVLAASQKKPSVIILDLMMPVMDGRTFRERQLDRPDLAAIPVVVVSAHQEADAIGEVSFDGYLTKPLDLSALLAAVGRHCEVG